LLDQDSWLKAHKMKLERSDIDFPIWRKKVDSSLFQYKSTPIPNWACKMWNIDTIFQSTSSKKDPTSKVDVVFEKLNYNGWVTITTKGRKYPAFRLWFTTDLQSRLKEVFIMSFMRDLESRLRKNTERIEDDIPFWEFIDIEFDTNNNIFYLTAYYTQKPSFPELFKRLIGSPVIHRIDDELSQKSPFRIYKQDWRPRKQIDFEIGTDNALYTLIDTKSKLIYVGEASDLVKRLKGNHPTIKEWDYYRYEILPKEITDEQRITLERMLSCSSQDVI
jgi:hypothetical protein